MMGALRQRTLAPTWIALACAACACGSNKRAPSDDERQAKDRAGVAGDAGAGVELIEPVPMGVADLRAFAYSMGPGREPFLLAKQANQDSDTSAVIEHGQAAVAADAGHLEAHWYLAMALARSGRYHEVAEHLSVAVAGDWMRWGERSLDIKALADFYDTPAGRGYRQAAGAYREQFRAMVAEGVLVVGRRGLPWEPRPGGDGSLNHRAEIYAFHLPTERYLRLSRSDGTLVGFLPSPDRTELSFVSYRAVHTPPADDALEREPYIRKLTIATIDLNQVAMSGTEVALDGVAELWLAYLPAAPAEPTRPDSRRRPDKARLLALVRSPAEAGQPATVRTYEIDIARGRAVLASAGAHPLEARQPAGADQSAALEGDVLHVAYNRVERLRIPIEGVMADWDENGAAGAFRLAHTRKTVTLSGGVLANGHTMSWSPARTRLAFADLPGEPCERKPDTSAPPAVTLYAVEAATGILRQVASAPGLQAPEWVDEQRLAFARPSRGHSVVEVVDVTTAESLATLATQGGVGTSHLAGHPFDTPGCANPTP
jgi:hypothetical protein